MSESSNPQWTTCDGDEDPAKHECDYCHNKAVGFQTMDGFYYCEIYRTLHICPRCDWVNDCGLCSHDKKKEKSKTHKCSLDAHKCRKDKECGMPCLG